MEDLQVNVDAVIQKWSTHHATSSKPPEDEKTWYKQPSNIGEGINYAINRKRSRKLMKSKVRDERTLAVEQVLQTQRRFKLTPPVLKSPFQEHHTHSCKKCHNVLEYVKINNNVERKSQPLHVMEHITTIARSNLLSIVAPSLSFALSSSIKKTSKKKSKTSEAVLPSSSLYISRLIAWKMIQYLQTSFTSLCFQSKDETDLEILRQNDYPIIFVHNCRDIFSTIITHLCLLCIDSKIPLTVVNESTVTSSIFRYILTKIGVLFLNENEDGTNINHISEQLLSYLNTNQSILIPSRVYALINSKGDRRDNMIDHILDAQRANDIRLSRAIVIAATLSLEMEENESRRLSLWDMLKLTYSPKKFGLAQLNLSQPVKLKSIAKVGAELNHQESCEEENNIISRHLSFDFHETSAILPINIVAFLLLTRHRKTTCIEISVLINQAEHLIEELKSLNKYLGFTGNTESVVWHALKLMTTQDLVEISEDQQQAILTFHDPSAPLKIFKYSYKVLHFWISYSILASSIIASLGGTHALHQGNGESLTFTASQVFQKAEFLAEIVSFFIDFHCSFNLMTDSLTSAFDQFVAMGVLQTFENNYEDMSHQRLAHNLNLELELGDDDEDDEHGVLQSNEKTYQVIYTEEGIQKLQYFSGLVKPFVDLCYTLLAIIREEIQDKKFSVKELFEILKDRNEKQLFGYGEMTTLEFTSRFCDYLFESEIIDDDKDTYCISQAFLNNKDSFLYLLHRISELR